MRAVCTRNGWSPNPADLSCVGMLSGFHPEIFLREGGIRVLKMTWMGQCTTVCHLGGCGGCSPRKFWNFRHPESAPGAFSDL